MFCNLQKNTMPRYNQEVIKYNKLIGQKILFRRKEIGLTIEKLAKEINVSTQQLYMYQIGRGVVAGRLVQLAKVLKVELGYFYYDT